MEVSLYDAESIKTNRKLRTLRQIYADRSVDRNNKQNEDSETATLTLSLPNFRRHLSSVFFINKLSLERRLFVKLKD